jgi:cysteinyl-tRNA synthetase
MYAMANDLDSVAAVEIMTNLAAEICHAAQAGQSVQAAQEALRTMGRIFGLRLGNEEAEAVVVSGWNQHLARALRQEDRTPGW